MKRSFGGGRILTMDPSLPSAETLVVENGRIIGVGGSDLLLAHPDAEFQDLVGQTLTPGFIDAHNHICHAAFEPVWCDLHDATTKDEVLRRLRRHAEAHPERGWIHGFKYIDEMYGGAPLDRHDLDELGFDRPVFLMHVSFHVAVVNTKALELLGIGRSTPDPQGGEFQREPNGLPTGRLIETAWCSALEASIKDHGEPDTWADLIEARARFMLRHGVTAIHDTGVPPAAEDVYRRLHREGRLPLSVLMMPHGPALLDNNIGDRLDGPVTGEGDEWLRVGPVKLFADGADETTVGVSGTQAGVPFKMGDPRSDFREQLLAAVERGFRVTLHGIGNTTLDACLDAFEEASRRRDTDHRFRVEHMYLASQRQLKRAKSVGMIAGLQPAHISHLDLLLEFPLDGLAWLPFRQIDELGIPIAAGSDDPCSQHDDRSVLIGAARGETRRAESGTLVHPEESLPFERWLEAYTTGAAFAGGQEHERGRLAPGLRGDLVVLNGPLSAENPPTVAETWIEGTRVYQEGAP